MCLCHWQLALAVNGDMWGERGWPPHHCAQWGWPYWSYWALGLALHFKVRPSQQSETRKVVSLRYSITNGLDEKIIQNVFWNQNQNWPWNQLVSCTVNSTIIDVLHGPNNCKPQQQVMPVAAGSYPSTILGLGVPYDTVHNVIFEK